MKVFISGPMRGYPNDNVDAFFEAEKKLEEAGFETFNPARMRFEGKWERRDIWRVDLAALDICDAIYQLPGWNDADGALVEAAYALMKDKANVTRFFDEGSAHSKLEE